MTAITLAQAQIAVIGLTNDLLKESTEDMGHESYPWAIGALSIITANLLATGKPGRLNNYLPMTEEPEPTYDDIIENHEWLEDRGKMSRYYIGDDRCVWVNNETCEIDDDF